MVGDRDFSSSRLLGMRSKGVADDTLVAADLSLDQCASIVSAGSLPTATAPAAMFRMCPSRWVGKFVSWQRPPLVEERSQGHPDVVPRQPHRDRRHHKRHHPGTRQQSLIEQRCNVRAVVDVTTGQRASDNLARDCVQADMQFVPCAALCCSMLFDPPIARTIQLRPVLSTINCRGPTGRRVHFGKATV